MTDKTNTGITMSPDGLAFPDGSKIHADGAVTGPLAEVLAPMILRAAEALRKSITTGSDAVDLDRLEKLASNAEQMFGKWFSTHQIADGITDDDAAAFIAAMTPGTVVALIAQARADAPALPQGFVLVPTEPTDDMVEYGRGQYAADPDRNDFGRFADVYRAMIAIAPSPLESDAAPAAMSNSSEFEGIDPARLLEVARATGLRQHLHGVSATDARALLAAFVAALSQQPVQAAGAAALYVRECDLDGTMPGSTVVAAKSAGEEWTVPLYRAAPAIAAPTAPSDIKDLALSHAAWRSKGPKFGVHFYEDSLARFVEALRAAPTATAEPVAILRRVRALAEKWNKDAIEIGFAGSEPAYELFELLDAAPAPQQAAPLTDGADTATSEALRAALIELASTQRKLIDANAEIAAMILAGSAASAGDAPQDDTRSLILGQAVAHHGGVWPAELWTGVMRFNGQRITKAEFEDRAAMAATKEKEQ